MAVPVFLNALEKTSLSTWLRESPSLFGFYFVLTLHTIGLTMLVGPNAAIDLRLLGVARDIPIAPMKSWFPLMWLGFAVNAVTGVFLVIAYPTKAVTNPDFYLKLALIGVALWIMQRLKTYVFEDLTVSESVIELKGRTLAIASLSLWVGVIASGRLLAYTYTYIMYGRFG